MALTAKKVYAILKRQISDMEAKLNSPVRYRGTVATADLLPINPDIGDMYNIESKSVYGEAGMNVAWNGVVWDTMGAPIDMSLYIKSSELADWVKQQNKPTYTAEEVGALPVDTKIPSKTSDLQNDSGFLTKIPDNYLSGTDKTLSVSGKAADAKATGDKITELSADISNKLNKNQGSENSGKIAGINESGDIVPMFPVSVDYNEETNCLEFGADQKMKLNQGIGLDSSLTKTGYAADAGAVGEVTSSLKEDISTKITKFYASSQGETHLADSDDGKIMDMIVYGKSEQKQYSGKNLLNATLQTTTQNGVTCTNNGDGTYTVNGTASENVSFVIYNVSTPSIFEYGKTYKLIGCPNNGDYSKYYMLLNYWDAPPVFDVGNGTTKQYTSEKEGVRTEICISKGTTVNNLLFKPMIVDASLYPDATYDDYEPYTGGQPSPSPNYSQEIKSVVNLTVKITNEAGTQFKTVTLPYTLNAIPVSSGGNVTIDGQQYIADYVDVERGKLVQMVGNINFDNIRYESKNSVAYFTPSDLGYELSNNVFTGSYIYNNQAIMFNALSRVNTVLSEMKDGTWKISDMLYIKNSSLGSKAEYLSWFNEIGLIGMIMLAEPEEIDLTPEEIAAFKALATYYPTTNISVNSEQLDGYTVFNYPISMANGWNYVKQQLNDNRDYIYDMDTKTQDIDTQAAEAYVNSEYAVALTELEV